MLESANDAAVTLAEGVSGIARGVRARDEPARGRARAAATRATRTRSASTTRTTTRARATSPRWRGGCSRSASSRGSWICPMATLKSGARPRMVDNRNLLVQRYPFVSGVKTGHTLGAGYVLVGSGAAGRRARDQRRCSARPARRRATRTRSRSCAAGSSSSSACACFGAASRSREIDVNYRDEDAEVGAATAGDARACGAASTLRPSGRPGGARGADRQGRARGLGGGRARRATVRRVPLVTLDEVRGRQLPHARCVAHPWTPLLIVAMRARHLFAS